ncbi:beta-ketoacyl synthase N-terminal-like domain-containing protein, partial [Maribacter sp. 2307UL18-2]|uniref:type I polyketide synthase n=1 Tax=Maribacter sp. 2307UL18-2 TaxID=3386274 RepID=UPI0039BCF309
MKINNAESFTGFEIAIVGLSGRFPEADNVQQFWNNMVCGKNSIGEFSEEELINAGEDRKSIEHPKYIRFGSYLRSKEYFDSGFFNYIPNEAELMDPQMRLFHQVCWHALEDSGYGRRKADDKIGLFAGSSSGLSWTVHALLKNGEKSLVDDITTQLLSSVTHLSSMIAYKLNLNGPVMFLQTACSSSLSAIHEACNSLLLGECKMALAGGVTLNNFSKRGYLYQKNSIQSGDGHCRPFDAGASGTIFGEGAGVVVLKRLKDALADKDTIHAIIKGSAINNDGNSKIGYTAPSVKGQVEVITKALKMSKIPAESVGYLEAHGTGTVLGDPIEVEALNRSYGRSEVPYCALGSVKANIGHLDTASGVAGLIKAVLALKNKKIPPSVNFEKPNPKIDFNGSPFYINMELRDWTRGDHPLRAGVSSLGIGGTNVHVILEEAPMREASSSGRACQLLTVSGKTPVALKGNVSNLMEHLSNNEDMKLSDIAYTLNARREPFGYRSTFVCKSHEEAIGSLSSFSGDHVPLPVTSRRKSVVFMFPGQGSQYVNMCLGLFEKEQVFREHMEECFSIVSSQSGKDIRSVVFSKDGGKLNETEYTQPALFMIEYSLARLLMSWGVRPDVMIGHSLGEYVAACLSGVFTLEDALRLVVKRGELMQNMEKGSMLGILVSEGDLGPYLKKHKGVSLATVNSPTSCVVSGLDASIDKFKELLDGEGITNKKLDTSHAFHSSMMDGMLVEFEQAFTGIKLGSQQVPFISNVTGRMAKDDAISDPRYWVGQLRGTVRFSDGISSLMNRDEVCFVEVGPGKALGSFVGSNTGKGPGHRIITLLGTKNDSLFSVTNGLGKLWQQGVEIDWEGYYQGETRHNVSLPGYSFEKTKYPVDVDAKAMIMDMVSDKSLQRKELSDWFYAPTWRLSGMASKPMALDDNLRTLVFSDGLGIGESIIEHFSQNNTEVVTVRPGSGFKQETPNTYILDPNVKEDYLRLYKSLGTANMLPERIVHCLGVREDLVDRDGEDELKGFYFYSLLNMIESLEEHKNALKEVTVLTDGLHPITDKGGPCSPIKSLAIGFLKVLGQEYPTITTGHIDISLSETIDKAFMSKLFNEIMDASPGKVVSHRNSCRWVQVYEKVKMAEPASKPLFRDGGVYLITGGLGGFGYAVSEYLGREFKAKLILLGRESLPSRGDRDRMLGAGNTPEGVSEKLKKIRSIEDQGGEVLYFDCDISDTERFLEVVKQGEGHFGTLNGVFHAAGVVNGSSMDAIERLSRSDYEAQFSPKISGLRTLYGTLKDRDLDFCMLTSSLASVLGGLRFGAYSTANTFMDYFVQFHKRQGRLQNWVSVNFDGIDFGEGQSEEINGWELPELISYALSPKELPQLVVSTKELQPRLDDWISKDKVLEGTISGVEIEEVPVDELVISGLSPNEKLLIRMWANFFGRSDFDIDDDFFEIGGDSLKALTLSARINKELNVNLSLSDFFTNPTIKGLAGLLSEPGGTGPITMEHVSVQKAPSRDYYDLSAAQRRLYFLYEMDRSSLAYNLPRLIELK